MICILYIIGNPTNGVITDYFGRNLVEVGDIHLGKMMHANIVLDFFKLNLQLLFRSARQQFSMSSMSIFD